MFVRTNHSFVIFVTALLLSAASHAQGLPDKSQDVEASRSEIGIFGVIPLANGSLQGITSDRQFLMFGVSYRQALLRRNAYEIHWVPEIMPFELLREPFLRGTNLQTLKALPFTESRFTFGGGAKPLGADAVFFPRRGWQPYAGVHSGFSFFDRNVLSSRAAQFNFMIDGRAGLRIPLSGGQSLSAAFMFQHMSNAYTAHDNPGVDSYQIQVTYGFPFRFRRAK